VEVLLAFQIPNGQVTDGDEILIRARAGEGNTVTYTVTGDIDVNEGATPISIPLGVGALTSTGQQATIDPGTPAPTQINLGLGSLTATGQALADVNPTNFRYIQSNTSEDSNTVTLNGVTAGSLIVLVAKWNTDTGAITGVTDGTDSLSAATQQDVNSDMSVQIWYLLSSTSGNKTYTVTYPGSAGGKRLIVAEFTY
jgi:hypothetical protein